MRRLDRFLAFAAVACALTATWLFWTGLSLADTIDAKSPNALGPLVGAYFTAASLFAATGGWLVSNAVSLLAKTREKASDFISVAQSDTEFLEALRYIGSIINAPGNDEALADPARRHAFYGSADSLAFRMNMRRALNMFDEMAIFIRRGAADEEILRDFYVGMVVRFYEAYRLFSPLITNIPRSDPARDQRPEIITNIDWLYRRWLKFYNRQFFYGEDRHVIELTGPWFRRVNRLT